MGTLATESVRVKDRRARRSEIDGAEGIANDCSRRVRLAFCYTSEDRWGQVDSEVMEDIVMETSHEDHLSLCQGEHKLANKHTPPV